MDCTVEGHNVRTFCLIFSCLGRIARDVYIEFTDYNGMFIKTVNDSKSAFASFHFPPRFFGRCIAVPLITSKPMSLNYEPGLSTHENDAFACRMPVRALNAILRPRKGTRSLRIRSHGNVVDDRHHSQEQNVLGLKLTFEFLVEHGSSSNACMRIHHSLAVAESYSIVAASPSKLHCSEIVTSSQVLFTLLEALRKSLEVTWTLRNANLDNDDEVPHVAVSSFNRADCVVGSTYPSTNREISSIPNSFKTEAIMECSEFEGFVWRGGDEIDVLDDHPANQRHEVCLVFGLKEVKALLQFCSHVDSSTDMRVSMSFVRGGKPLIFETKGNAFAATLTIATLDRTLYDDKSAS